jgi:NADH dehydrogenase
MVSDTEFRRLSRMSVAPPVEPPVHHALRCEPPSIMATESEIAISQPNTPSVVVVGAGFAGLEAVRTLANSEVHVTLVDMKNHHCFQPLLYQLATAALSPADVAWPIRSILAGQRNAAVLMAEVKAMDTVSRVLITTDGVRLPFDYLVVAMASPAHFNHPEWAKYAPGLKTIEDATRIRARR